MMNSIITIWDGPIIPSFSISHDVPNAVYHEGRIEALNKEIIRLNTEKDERELAFKKGEELLISETKVLATKNADLNLLLLEIKPEEKKAIEIEISKLIEDNQKTISKLRENIKTHNRNMNNNNSNIIEIS